MFEKRILELSKRFGRGPKQTLYRLTHKKHRREIYFSKNPEAIKFLKSRFSSFEKKLALNLSRFGILRPFLKKIKVSKKMGDVIFVANSIKCFDLKNRKVLSLIKKDPWKELFIKDTTLRKKIGRKDFAPKVFEINKKIPFAIEELLIAYRGGDDLNVFKRLLSWYKKEKITSISSKKYIKNLEEGLIKKRIKSPFLNFVLDEIKKQEIDLLISSVHGSFSKEQVLVKGKKYFFIDWSDDGILKRDLLIRDFSYYFRKEENPLKDENLRKILKIYPKEVKKNIVTYLILSDLSDILRRGIKPKNLRRIKNNLKYLKKDKIEFK